MEPSSAGLRPQPKCDAENAVFTLANIGIDASGHEPRNLGGLDLNSYDLIVAMDKNVREELQLVFQVPENKLKAWNIDDPYGHNLEEYASCARAITDELRKLRLP